MYSKMYSTVQTIVKRTQGSTMMKGDFQRKRCVLINILEDSFIY